MVGSLTGAVSSQRVTEECAARQWAPAGWQWCIRSNFSRAWPSTENRTITLSDWADTNNSGWYLRWWCAK